MPLLHRGGGMGAKGFGLTSVNTLVLQLLYHLILQAII